MDYLRWSKVHSRVSLELVHSGVPSAQLDDFGATAADLELEVQGTYGDPALIESIAARYGHAETGIVPVPGASCGIFVALAVAAERGAKVLVEQPVYQPMTRVAEFLGFDVLPLRRPANRGFEISLNEVEDGLKRGARAVFLTNLHNPSGCQIPREVMKAVAEACRHAEANLVVDEVYLDSVSLTKGGPLWTAASFGDHVLTFNSLTKVYGLSGLRVGWVLAGSQLAEKARVFMDLLNVNNCAPSAGLARRAFQNIARLETRFRRFHAEGQSIFRRWLSEERRVQGYANHGAIFELVRLPQGVSADRLNEVLVREFDTQVVSGRFFDLPDHVRIGIAVSPDRLSEALARISAALSALNATDRLGCLIAKDQTA